MILKFKEYYLESNRFILSILIGFIVSGAFYIFISSKFYEVFQNILMQTEESEDILRFNDYLIFIRPIVILLMLYLTFRMIKSNNHILISGIVSLASTMILSLITLIVFNSIDIWFLLTHIISIFALTIAWIVFVQTQEAKANALSTGYFAFLVILIIAENIQEILFKQPIGYLSVFGGIFFAGLVSVIFGEGVKLSMKLLRVNLKGA